MRNSALNGGVMGRLVGGQKTVKGKERKTRKGRGKGKGEKDGKVVREEKRKWTVG